jgi:hypothetical protein
VHSEIEVLTQRLARLERANLRLKVLGVGTGLVSGAILLMGFAGQPRTIEAEKIVIRDSHHRARLTIGTPEYAGVAIMMKPDEPAIWLSDENGSDRAIVSSDGLYFANGRGKPLASLSTGPGQPELRLYGQDGKISWSAP